MRNIVFIYALFIGIITIENTHSESIAIIPDEKSELDGNDVSIYFQAGVDNKSMAELQSAIEMVNVNYKNVKNINLYIVSGGGHLHAAWAASLTIKNSKIPVRTINMAMTASAATVLYCAADERYTMNGATFVLHAVSKEMVEPELTPDKIEQQLHSYQIANKLLEETYKNCTNYTDASIKEILDSRYFTKHLTSKEANDLGISKISLKEMLPSAGAVFIHD